MPTFLLMFLFSLFPVSLSNSPSHRGTSVHGDPSSSRPGVQPHLPPPASSPGPPPAIRVEAGLPSPHRRTVQRPAWRHQLPRQSSEPRGLRRVHLWHHQRGWGRALHLPGHRWASWWSWMTDFDLFDLAWCRMIWDLTLFRTRLGLSAWTRLDVSDEACVGLITSWLKSILNYLRLVFLADKTWLVLDDWTLDLDSQVSLTCTCLLIWLIWSDLGLNLCLFRTRLCLDLFLIMVLEMIDLTKPVSNNWDWTCTFLGRDLIWTSSLK